MACPKGLAILLFNIKCIYGSSSRVEYRSPKPLMGVRIPPPVLNKLKEEIFVISEI
jgi:hypothetical protein